MRSESFQNWFAQGGLANESGEPVVLYHGAPQPEGLSRFVPGGPIGARTTGDAYGVASYFTTSPAEASSYATLYAQDEGAVLPVYIRGELLHVDGPLHPEHKKRLTKFAAQVLLPSDKARFTTGLAERRFTDLQDARDFFDAQRKNWEVFGDGMERAKPEADASGDEYIVRYTDFDADVRIETGEDAYNLFRAVGWDNLPAAGFDGMVMARDGGAKWVVMHRPDGNVKSAIGNVGTFNEANPDIRFSLAAEPPRPAFYSQLARVISAAKQEQMPADQWAAWFNANLARLGVKRDEYEWSGLPEFLDIRAKQRVSREELSGFVRDNGVRVVDVVNRDPVTVARDLERRLGPPWSVMYDSVQEAMDFLNTEDGEQYLLDELPEELRSLVDDLVTPGEAKFAQWALPGGESYREVLLTTPGGQPVGSFAEWLGRRLGVPASAAEETPEYENDSLHDLFLAEESRTKASFHSKHWSEPNVLAHLRVDDRTDADGKRVLFIHELQSDWGQQGKKKGVKPTASELRDLEPGSPAAIMALAMGDLGGMQTTVDDGFGRPISLSLNPQRDLSTQLDERVQAAPFIRDTKAWVGLALKRAIMMAVEGGYDRVALISGQQAVDLYSLRKQVEQIRYIARDNGTYDVWASDKLGAALSDELDRQYQTPDQIEEMFGKDILKKIQEGVGRAEGGDMVLEGVDLEMGGDGLRAFYDQIVPAVLRDVLRKLGGAGIERVALEEAGREPEMVGLDEDGSAIYDDGMQVGGDAGGQLGFTITPALREKVLAGVPLFSLAAVQEVARDDLLQFPDYQEGAMGEGGFLRTLRTEQREVAFRAQGLVPYPFGGVGEAWVKPHEAAFLDAHGFGRGHLNQSALHALQVAEAGLDPILLQDRFVSEWVDNLGGDKEEGVAIFERLRGSAQEAVRARQATPESVRSAIAHLVRMTPEELKDGMGTIVVTTSEELQASASVQRDAAFQAWFEGSKVVDEAGKPLTVYHGTLADFSVFERTRDIGFHFGTVEQAHGRFGRFRNGRNVMPVHLSIRNPIRIKDDPRAWMPDYVVKHALPEGVLDQTEAEAILKESAAAVEAARDESAALRVANGGKRISSEKWTEILYRHTSVVLSTLRGMLEAKGYDGMVYCNKYEGKRSAKADSWIAFRPEQIKSAVGNQGTYDPLDPDIRHSLANSQQGAFDRWFGASKVVDASGKPLRVFRGEHGATADGDVQTLVGSYTFIAESEIASSYAMEPNDCRVDPQQPRLVPAYLRIEKPVIENRDDPFVDLSDLIEKFGVEEVTKIALKHASRIEYTGNWLEDPEGRYEGLDSVEQLVAERPDLLGTLYMDAYPLLDDPEFVALAGSKGYDGAIHVGNGESSFEDEYRVFSKSQIKSAIGNRGTYDPRDPDIRHSLAAGAAGLDPRAQAFHDVATNTTVFLADRIPAGKEASVFLHETVHRHGRQALPEGRWGALVDQVKAWAHAGAQSPEKAIHDAAAARVATAGVAGAVADEELFAYAVEEAVAMGIEPTAAAVEGSAEAWLQVVVESIQRVTDKLLGNDLQELGGQDLVDLAYALAQLDSPEHGTDVRRVLEQCFGRSNDLVGEFIAESENEPALATTDWSY